MLLATDCGGSINAVSTSADGRHVVVGGRDVLKTYALTTSRGLVEVKNLRATRKKGLELACNDVAWHPLHDHVIASGSTSGAVLVWDLHAKSVKPGSGGSGSAGSSSSSGGSSGSGGGFKHARTVNRVAWHPLCEAWLLTASQDGTCRLWDARCAPGASATGSVFPASATAAAAVAAGASPALRAALAAFAVPDGGLTVQSRTDSVRDVAFDPFRPLTFAAATEDGSVHIYDVRTAAGAGRSHMLAASGSGALASAARWSAASSAGGGGSAGAGRGGPLLRFTAHVGLVMSLAWHPSQPGLFATGGRDRLVKVWSLASHGGGSGRVTGVLERLAAGGAGVVATAGAAHSSAATAAAAAAAAAGSGAPFAEAVSPLFSSATGGGAVSAPPSASPVSGAHHGFGAHAPSNAREVTQLVSIQSIASVSRLAWRGATPAAVPSPDGYGAAAAASVDIHVFDEDDDGGGSEFIRPALGTSTPAGGRAFRRLLPADEGDDDDDAVYSSSSGSEYDDDDASDAQREAVAGGRRAHDADYQLGTCAALLDAYVTVWDVRRPYLPVAQFGGHKDVATGIAWIPPPPAAVGGGDEDDDSGGTSSGGRGWHPWLLSAGKDGRLVAQAPSAATRPHATLRTTALALSSTHLAWVHQPIQRDAYWRTGEGAGGGSESERRAGGAEGKGVDNPADAPLGGQRRAILVVPSEPTPQPSSASGGDGDAADTAANDTPQCPPPQTLLSARIAQLLAPMFRGVNPAPPPLAALVAAAEAAAAAGAGGVTPASRLSDLPALAAPIFDPPPHAFAELARRYQSEGAPPHVLCTRNADVAAELGLPTLAQTWRVLGALWTPLPPPPPPPPAPQPAAAALELPPAHAVEPRAPALVAAAPAEEFDAASSAAALTPPPTAVGADVTNASERRRRKSSSAISAATATATYDGATAVSQPAGSDAVESSVTAALAPATSGTELPAPTTGATRRRRSSGAAPKPAPAPVAAVSTVAALAPAAAPPQPLITLTIKPPKRSGATAAAAATPTPDGSTPAAVAASAQFPPGYIVGLLDALDAANPDGAASDAFATTDDDGGSATGDDSRTEDGYASTAAASVATGGGRGVGTRGPSVAVEPGKSNGPAVAASTVAQPAATESPTAAAAAEGPAAKAGAVGATTAPAPAPAAAQPAAMSTHPPSTTLSAAEAASWHASRLAVAADVLAWHADGGDVQTAVTVARVLGRDVEAAVGRRRLQAWLVAYIDLLHRRQLWAPASTVMARASDEGIRRLNQMHTALAPMCAACGRDVAQRPWGRFGHERDYAQRVAAAEKEQRQQQQQQADGASPSAGAPSSDAPPSWAGGGDGEGDGDGAHVIVTCDDCVPPSGPGFVVAVPPALQGHERADDDAVVGISTASDATAADGAAVEVVGTMQALAPARCDGCTRPVSSCAVCLVPVRGVYLWCQGCGHGGHLSHMTAWFAGSSTLCPTGCMHTCHLEVGGAGGAGSTER